MELVAPKYFILMLIVWLCVVLISNGYFSEIHTAESENHDLLRLSLRLSRYMKGLNRSVAI